MMTRPDPTTPLDTEAIRQRLTEFANEGKGDDLTASWSTLWPLATRIVQDVPHLLAALAEAQRERDEARTTAEEMTLAVKRLVGERDDAILVLNNVRESLELVGANFDAADTERELMRPVVEAVGPMIANWRKNGYRPDSYWATPQSHALVAAWDTYETQEGTDGN